MIIDIIQENIEQKNTNSSIIVSTVLFYAIEHNSQFECWIGIQFNHEFSGILFYIRLKFQVNCIFERHHNTS